MRRNSRRDSALADAGVTEDGDEVRPPLARRRVPRSRREPLQLTFAADDRVRRLPLSSSIGFARTAIHASSGSDLPFATIGSAGSYSIASRVARYVSFPTRTPLIGRPLLEARGGVDDVARHHRLAERRPCVERNERFARVDRDPKVEIDAEVTHRERGANRALRIVAECGRRAEDAHHRVADELLDDAAERLDLAPDGVVVRHRGWRARPRVELLGTGGEADQVDEDHADEAPFLPSRPAEPPPARFRMPGRNARFRCFPDHTPSRVARLHLRASRPVRQLPLHRSSVAHELEG